MTVEFIGSLVNGTQRGPQGLNADPGYPARMAALHEASGFDRLLVGQSSSAPDGFLVADQVLHATSRAAGSSTALVGSYEQVAEALVDYLDIGVSTLLIRGCAPEEDASDYATIIGLVREQIEHRTPAPV